MVMQDDDGTVFRSQAPERPIQCIAIVDGDGLVGSTRSVDREGPNVFAPPPVPAELLVTGVHEESMEPDLETLRVTQPRELAPGEEECLLDGVLGPLGVPKDSVRDRVAPVSVQVDQLGEGDLVARSRQFDQPHSQGLNPSAAPRQGASVTKDDGGRRKVQTSFVFDGYLWPGIICA